MTPADQGLITYTCNKCGKKIDTLPNSRVWCPICRKWIKPENTGDHPKPAITEPGPERAKPFHTCHRCGKVYRANSNREKYCNKCKPVINQKGALNRIHKFRSKISRCNGLGA